MWFEMENDSKSAEEPREGTGELAQNRAISNTLSMLFPI
jgi:hypothetical protein